LIITNKKPKIAPLSEHPVNIYGGKPNILLEKQIAFQTITFTVIIIIKIA
jgi:hypothetical protein